MSFCPTLVEHPSQVVSSPTLAHLSRLVLHDTVRGEHRWLFFVPLGPWGIVGPLVCVEGLGGIGISGMETGGRYFIIWWVDFIMEIHRFQHEFQYRVWVQK